MGGTIVNLIWLKKSPTEWISIDLNEIKSFEHLNNWLYINNKIIISDHQKVLFNALAEYMKGARGSKYLMQGAVIAYNATIVELKITDESLGLKTPMPTDEDLKQHNANWKKSITDKKKKR